MIDFAEELGAPMNLGGGVTPGDGLEAFKQGFSNAELAFRTHEIVCDAQAYRDLSADRDDDRLLPALPRGLAHPRHARARYRLGLAGEPAKGSGR